MAPELPFLPVVGTLPNIQAHMPEFKTIVITMKKEFIQEMEEKLMNEKRRLEKELAEFAKQNPKNAEDYDATFPNMGDKEDENAEEVDTFSTNLTLERTLESSLRDVEKALDRIKKNNYGICKYCSREIDEKRLIARPSSSSCVECKKSFTQEL
jgi:DnaK suppressor protein